MHRSQQRFGVPAWAMVIALFLLGTALGGCEAVSDREFQEFNFQSLTLSDRPNQYLVSPPGLTPNAKPNAVSPEYNVPLTTLQEAFHQVALSAPRTILTDETQDRTRARFVQRSLIFRFPDIIDVAFLNVSETTATLQIYSRSVYGYSDWGVNQSRIEGWLDSLGKELQRPAQ